jgi:cobalt/nickel transport system ATP-binding protein
VSHHKIEVINLNYTYPDGNKVLKNIDFKIGHGEAVGIVGANGAGKSTLLMLLTGILPPSAGQVRIGDTPMGKKTMSMLRQRIGMIFQDPDDQLFMATVYDDVAFGPRNYGLDENEVGKRVLEALEITGISHLKDRAPFKLSGGEKREAAIASVLSMQPDILIMDEPTASLDPRSRRRLIELLKSFEHTRIITSHDMDMIYELCERVIVLKDGEIAADGLSRKLLSDSELMEACGLEVPLSIRNCPICGSKKEF